MTGGGGSAGWGGGEVSPLARCVLAPNPGPMTLEGTNTWLVAAPGSDGVVVVDPGPDLAAHRQAVLTLVSQLRARVEQVVLTHGHPDHADGARALVSACASPPPVLALDPALCLGSPGLTDGAVIEAAGVQLEVAATPGHTADSVCLVLRAPGHAVEVLTGDTVLGRGPSVVAHPDGRLGPYLESLDRLAVLCAAVEAERLLPGHGPVLDDPGGAIEGYRAHRRERLAQVVAAVRSGARTPDAVVDAVYAGLDPALRLGALASVRAQLAYVRELSVGAAVQPLEVDEQD